MKYILKIYHNGIFFAQNEYSSYFYNKEQVRLIGEDLTSPYSNRSFTIE